ncbi:MAG: class II aldolase/adducin family protein [Thermoanaerobaculia bacterium]|nr:class II aldolase/adducin family protein [Thermoanaerobaculia bacterium]
MRPPNLAAEGVIKFATEHRRVALDSRRYGSTCCALLSWRQILALTGLVGQTPQRYEGFGYGNVSARVGAPSMPRGRRAFLISGTQTSGLQNPTLGDFCIVEAYDIDSNRIRSHGSTLPSSESLTHAAVYDLGTQIRCVLHVHSPILWRRAKSLRIPQTAPGVAYGTPDMAREVRRLYRETHLEACGIFSMAGHEDGIVAFGHDLATVGANLVERLAQGFETECSDARIFD